MPNKTIYLSRETEKILRKVRRNLEPGESLSSIFIEYIKRRLDELDSNKEAIEKIQ